MLSVAHVVVETRSGLSIGSGVSRTGRDLEVVRDAYNLPTIPGTALAGVLRDVYSNTRADLANTLADPSEIFGFAGKSAGEGARSCLEISYGVLHGSDDCPLVDPLSRKQDGDPLAKWFLEDFDAKTPVRHRVRINGRGVADAGGRGKFDRDVVPAGARFTFELSFWHDGSKSAIWEHLLASLDHPSFRLGGCTKAGFGACRVIRVKSGDFDLSTDEGLAAFARVSPSLAVLDCPALNPRAVAPTMSTAADHTTYELTLRLIDFWRVGQGQNPIRASGGVKDPDPIKDGAEADVSPYTEPVIVWKPEGGEITTENLLVPGSSIKGALRHRAAFHYDRLCSRLIGRDDPFDANATDHHPAVLDLFGSIPGKDSAAKPRRGRVIIDDVLVPLAGNVEGLQTLMHNSVDRFTGGVRDKILFSERLAFKGSFSVKITILKGASEATENADKALDLAIADLKSGRLPIGAASGRGHGRLEAI